MICSNVYDKLCYALMSKDTSHLSFMIPCFETAECFNMMFMLLMVSNSWFYNAEIMFYMHTCLSIVLYIRYKCNPWYFHSLALFYSLSVKLKISK